MISKPIVLILGAGASVEYGFPSGRGLTREVCKLAAGAPFNAVLNAGFKEDRIRAFQSELTLSDQPSVDAFFPTTTTVHWSCSHAKPWH